MPDSDALYHTVINSNARPVYHFELNKDRELKKRKTKFCGFLSNIFILVTCIVSLGICAQLYWDSYLRVQSLSRDLRLLREEFKILRQDYNEKIKNLHQELKGQIPVDKSESATEEISEELDNVAVTEEESNDPLLQSRPLLLEADHIDPSKANIFNQGQVFQLPEKSDDGESKNDRSKRSSLSGNSTNKSGKRSLVGNRVGTECENNNCDVTEVETQITNTRTQRLDDGKLLVEDFKSSEDTTHHSEENRTQVTPTTHHIIEQTNEPIKVVKNRKDKFKRKPKAEVEEEELQEESPKLYEPLLAAHFGGQTNKYIHTRHAEYLGNGHLYHPGGVFKDWEPSPWVRHLSMDRHFQLRDNGTLMVTKPGLYFVYAQIYYSNAHSLSSYRMYRNDEPLLQCTIEMHNKPEKTRNTCFAAGLAYLEAHDQLSLKEVEGERITIFEKTKSFFGLFKVNQN